MIPFDQDVRDKRLGGQIALFSFTGKTFLACVYVVLAARKTQCACEDQECTFSFVHPRFRSTKNKSTIPARGVGC